MQDGTATLDNSLGVLCKNKYALNIQPNIHILEHVSQRNVNLSPHKALHKCLSKCICISQRLEQPKCPSTDEWLNKV